jgi:hypothetical protein
MCKFASFVLTKNQEFYIDGDDSHSTVIHKLHLHEMGARGANIVKVEITPTDKIKKWPSLKAWKFVVDQDILPDWHDAATTEKRTRAALERRYKAGFKTVDARGCTALTELKADSAEYVYARGCTALTELKADSAKTVDASGCDPKLVIKAKKGCTIIR